MLQQTCEEKGRRGAAARSSEGATHGPQEQEDVDGSVFVDEGAQWWVLWQLVLPPVPAAPTSGVVDRPPGAAGGWRQFVSSATEASLLGGIGRSLLALGAPPVSQSVLHPFSSSKGSEVGSGACTLDDHVFQLLVLSLYKIQERGISFCV